ncbi:MAG: hypothetical protein IPH45_17225 [Bacteroidales bacterium]|nr:hypothetical protein [Bacteroidales bacterium]
MRRILALLFISFFFLTKSFAQNVEARWILSDSLTDCSELQYACMQLIPLYYQDGSIDTAYALLNYWEKKCGTDETIYRTKILWAIDAGTFNDSLISDQTIRHLDHYLWLYNDTLGESLDAYDYYVPEFELLKWYKSFTDSIVGRAQYYPDLSKEEVFFVKYYQHPSDSLLKLLETSDYKETQLFKVYDQPVYGSLSGPLIHYAAVGGAWIPYDKLSTLGSHPSLGGYIGASNKKMIYNLGLHFRIGSAANKYDVLYNDSLYSSDNFTGINISLEAGRQLINWRRHQFEILGGTDLEIINTLTLENDPDTDEDDESEYIYSPSIHLGAGYKYYLKNDRFIGLSSRYHFMNFKNKGGTNLRGNAISITLEYGMGTNPWLYKRETYLKQRISSN